MAAAGVILAALVLMHGVYFLSLTLAGFGILTLKSMNLSRHLRPRRTDESRSSTELAARIQVKESN
jgi:hypothetical protein